MKRNLRLALTSLLTLAVFPMMNSCSNQLNDNHLNEKTPLAETEEVASIMIVKRPDKLVYHEGEKFDPTGLELAVRYADKNIATEVIKSGYDYDKKEALTVDDEDVTISYQGKTTVLNITVNEVSYELKIDKLPTKLDYSSDKEVDLSGIEVTATSTLGEVLTLTSDDLKGVLNDDVLTVTYEDKHSVSFTVKTGSRENMPIGSQDWYGTTNQPNLLGVWDVNPNQAGASLPTIDEDNGTVTFTSDNYSRLQMFCVKYKKNDGSVYEPGNNIGAEVNNHVDGQEFSYTLSANSNGGFYFGLLMGNKTLFDLADENQMAIMVRFAEDQMTISSAEGGGTDQVLATSLSHYNYGKDNRIDFAFTRVKHCVTLKIYVNDVRVYFNDVAMSKHVNSALDNGNFTFMAGRYEDDENKGDGETGYRNYGDRLGVYADDETTLVLKDYE